MELFDTHCHIHFADYPLDADDVFEAAIAEHITRFLLVGCTLEDSEAAIRFAKTHSNTWASIGLHPHEGIVYAENRAALATLENLVKSPEVVAIGETGLDYFYDHSPRAKQKQLLEFQLDLAQRYNLPVILHVRDAFDDFWPLFDNFSGLKGVVHSFSAHTSQLTQALSRGLYVGLNGIMTFTKDEGQLEAARRIPLDRLVLETDAPYLTPVPFRGKICEPKHVGVTAEFLAKLRGENFDELAATTTQNAKMLFNL